MASTPSLSGCSETPRSPGSTVEGNSPDLPGPGDHRVSGPEEAVVDPAARPFRRSFTAAYRPRWVAEYEAAPQGCGVAS